jgi:hypothetical protein
MRYRLKSVLSFNYQAVRARNRHCVGVQSEALYIALRWSSKRSFVHCIALEFKAKLCVGVQSEALYIALRWNSKRSFALEFKAKLYTLHCVGIQSEALREQTKLRFELQLQPTRQNQLDSVLHHLNFMVLSLPHKEII